MANVRYWQKVAVDLQSALGTPTAITAITKANPPVVTSAAHGLNNGEYLSLSILGMRELNDSVVRVANKTTDTFELEGMNALNYGTFTSGTFTKVTLGTSISTILSVNASGGEPEFDDQTTIHDDIRKQAPTLLSAFTVTMESLWDPGDAGLVALKGFADTKSTAVIRVTYSDGAKLAFKCNPAASLLPTGQAPGKVTTPISLSGLGRPSVWST